jgi:hypothetical protein
MSVQCLIVKVIILQCICIHPAYQVSVNLIQRYLQSRNSIITRDWLTGCDRKVGGLCDMENAVLKLMSD